MASRFVEFVSAIKEEFEDNSDPITADWFLVSSIWLPLLILFLYFVLCFVVGPKLMSNRRPFRLELFGILYNLFILLTNGALFSYFMYYQIRAKFNPFCQPVRGRILQSNLRLAQGFYFYFLTKILELTDSVIIILKRRKAQMNCLHCYHHSSMLILAWVGVRFFPGGSSIVLATINTFFHFVVYLYYHLSCLRCKGFHLASYKPVATTGQIIQFSLAILHCITATILDCGYSRPVSFFIMMYITSFICLYYYNRISCCRTIETETRTMSNDDTDSRGIVVATGAPSTFLPRPGTFPSKTGTTRSVIRDKDTKLNDTKIIPTKKDNPRRKGQKEPSDELLEEFRQFLSQRSRNQYKRYEKKKL